MYPGSKRFANRRPNSFNVTSNINGGRTPPSSRVVLMKRANVDDQTGNGGRGDAGDAVLDGTTLNGSRQHYSQLNKSSTNNRGRMESLNMNAVEEFPPLMSPASSSAVSSPHKASRHQDYATECRKQQQNEIARTAGRGVMNMLKRDGFLQESAADKIKEDMNKHTEIWHRNDASGSSQRLVKHLIDAERKSLSRGVDTRSPYKDEYDEITTVDDQMLLLNNGSADSAYYTVADRQATRDQAYYYDSGATGDFNSANDIASTQQNNINYRQPKSNNTSRKSSVGTTRRMRSADTYRDDDNDTPPSLHDLHASELITEKLGAAQAGIKQQINAKLEFEKQQQQKLLATSMQSNGNSLKSDSYGAKSMPSATMTNVAGVIKLTKPIYDTKDNNRGTTSSTLTSTVRRPVIHHPSFLHPLGDVSLKEKYLPKPQCLISHNLEWQESTQKLLLREYLDEQNELFTVVACCGPQSSGKSTILSCLGIQSMGDFKLFDHGAHLIAPAQRQTASVNVYINAKQRVILLDSPGMLSSQMLAELMSRPTRPPPLFGGDKTNNIAGVHVYLEHQAEVYAYQVAAFLFAVSHVILFCSDRSPEDFYQSVGDFLHKTCIMKPPTLSVDTESPLCGVVAVHDVNEHSGGGGGGRRGGKANGSRMDKRMQPAASLRADGVLLQRNSVRTPIADHWPNLYFIVNKARDDGEDESALKWCSIPDDRVRLEAALKALVAATPIGRATRITDKLRLSATTNAARGGVADEEKWPKLAYENCQLFVVPFVGGSTNSKTSGEQEKSNSAVENGNKKSNNDTNVSDYAEDGEEQYNPALRFILDDSISSLNYSGCHADKSSAAAEKAPLSSSVGGEKRAGILTGVNLPHATYYPATTNGFRNRSYYPNGFFRRQPSASYHHRRPRAGLVTRAPSSHVVRYLQHRGGPVEHAFYTDLNNVESFIVEKSASEAANSDASSSSNSSGAVTWKDILAHKQAYETIARLRRTCFNAPALPITPGVRMSEKQWLRYASAMWSYIKSDAVILSYARAINMASSGGSLVGTTIT